MIKNFSAFLLILCLLTECGLVVRASGIERLNVNIEENLVSLTGTLYQGSSAQASLSVMDIYNNTMVHYDQTTTDVCGEFVFVATLPAGRYKAFVNSARHLGAPLSAEFIVRDGNFTPTEEELLADIMQSLSQKSHPYLYTTQEKLEQIRQIQIENTADSDSFAVRKYEETKAAADELLHTPTFQLNNTVDQGLRRMEGRIAALMTVYAVTENSIYLNRAKAEFDNLKTITTWTAAAFLDNSMSTEALAICYDWLYDYLSEEERIWAVETMKENALGIAYRYFKNPSCLSELRAQYNKMNIVLGRGAFNHNVYNNCNILISALAIAKEEPEYAAFLIANAISNIEPYWDVCAENGGFTESVNYYTYCTGRIIPAMAALKNALGTMYGNEMRPGFQKTAYYPIYMYSAYGAMVFGDCPDQEKEENFATDWLYFLAKESRDQDLMNWLAQNGQGEPVMPLLWYEGEALGQAEELPLDREFSSATQDVAVMRSSWEDDGIFAGLYTGQANANGHCDAVSGLFCLDAFGQRFVTALGRGDYNSDGYWDNSQNGKRWNYYVKRTEGGNCLVINPSEDVGQLVDANPRIERFESGHGIALAVADLTPTYANQVTSYQRGVKLFNRRTQMLVQDEVQLQEPSDIYWSFNTPALVDILDDHTALLTLKGKYVLVRVNANVDFTLKEDFSEKLPTSPTEPKESCFFYRKLSIRAENVRELKLAVEFTPMLVRPETSGEICFWQDLDDWITDTAPAEGEIRLYDRKGELREIQAGETVYCEAGTPADFVGGNLILALYDENDRLVQMVRESGKRGDAILRLQYTVSPWLDVSGYTVKAFLWNLNLTPFGIPVVVRNG